jgi:hypothetical protein
VVHAFLWSSAMSPVATNIPVIPKVIQYSITLDNFCKVRFQTSHHFGKIYHHFVFYMKIHTICFNNFYSLILWWTFYCMT